MKTIQTFLGFFEYHRGDWQLMILLSFVFLVIVFINSLLVFGAQWDIRERFYTIQVPVLNEDEGSMGSHVIQRLNASSSLTIVSVDFQSSDAFVNYISDGYAWIGLWISKNYTRTLEESVKGTRNHNTPIFSVFDEGRLPNLINNLRLEIIANSKVVSNSITADLLIRYANTSEYIGHTNLIIMDPVQIQPINLHPVFSVGLDVSLATMLGTLFLISSAYNSLLFALYKPLDVHINIEKPSEFFVIERLLPFLTMSICFGAITSSVILLLGGTIYHGYFALWGFLSLGILCYTAIQCISFCLFGPLGLLVLIVILPLQTAANGSVNALELSNPFFLIGYALPMYNILQGMRHIIYGSYNNIRINVFVLVGWYLILTVMAEGIYLFKAYLRERAERHRISTHNITVGIPNRSIVHSGSPN